MIQDFRRYIEKGEFIEGEGKVIEKDIKEEYLKLLKSRIDLGKRRVKVVLDAGNGTGSVVIKEAFEGLNIDAEYIFCDSDPDFPNHHPDPCVEANLEKLKAKVKEVHADIGLSVDGDADRVGVVDENGTFVPVDYLMIIIKPSAFFYILISVFYLIMLK